MPCKCVFCAQPPDAVFFNSYGQPEGCQRDECEFYVEWRNNEEFIDFRMEGNGDGWIALGITSFTTILTEPNNVSNTFVLM